MIFREAIGQIVRMENKDFMNGAFVVVRGALSEIRTGRKHIGKQEEQWKNVVWHDSGSRFLAASDQRTFQ